MKGMNPPRNPHKPIFLTVVCAYNEEANLRRLLPLLRGWGYDVLVVDDGSRDRTSEAALENGCMLLRHGRRMGKGASLSEAIRFAEEMGYAAVVEVGADAIPSPGSIERIVSTLLRSERIGGVSAAQVPAGPKGPAQLVDELMWAALRYGKAIQQALTGSAHLGAVMYCFRLPVNAVESIRASVNDDERVGLLLAGRGLKTLYEERATVIFDASSCFSHLVERRRRMILGHLLLRSSTAPSMNPSVAVAALARAVSERPSRIAWVVPAVLIELLARLLAWWDIRRGGYRRRVLWRTGYAKVPAFAYARPSS